MKALILALALTAQPWSLQDCIDWALEHNLTVAGQQLNAESADIDRNTAEMSWLPNLNASASENVSFGRGIGGNNTYEYGNSAKALENLNKVHNRAGLPAITETDQAKLRAIIQREDAVEFFQENHRYWDVKHWKRADIADGLCGGEMRMLQFNIKNDASVVWPYAAQNVETYWDAVAYNSYWSDAMFLEPFPQTEINKGTLTQNPGY